MRLVLDTQQEMFLKIESYGETELEIMTVIDGHTKKEIVDAGVDELDFYDQSGIAVGKLRFKSD